MSTEDLIKSALQALGGSVFAVFDGAKVPDLERQLRDRQLEGRRLYFGESVPPDLAPLLVGPIGGERNTTVIDLILTTGSASSTVLWLCEAGEDMLFRHLRGLNMALVDGEAFVFRHADANVMAQIVPALRVDLLSRLLGPAEAIVFLPNSDYAEADGKSPVKMLRRQTEWPAAAKGMLNIDADAFDSISQQRLLSYRRKRVRLLDDVCPDLFDGMSADEIREWSRREEDAGRSFGLRTDRGLFQWAYLMRRSNGAFIEHPEIRSHLKSGNPDERLDEIMRTMVRASRSVSA